MFTTNYQDKVTITINDDGTEIVVTAIPGGNPLGTIHLRECWDEERGGDTSYHITHLALDACQRKGIGTAALLFHKEVFRAPLTAGTSDGMRQDDGSYLTGAGVPFIAKMRELGIVCPDANSARHGMGGGSDEDPWD